MHPFLDGTKVGQELTDDQVVSLPTEFQVHRPGRVHLNVDALSWVYCIMAGVSRPLAWNSGLSI